MNEPETGPQYPAEEGSKISGDRTVAVEDAGCNSAVLLPLTSELAIITNGEEKEEIIENGAATETPNEEVQTLNRRQRRLKMKELRQEAGESPTAVKHKLDEISSLSAARQTPKFSKRTETDSRGNFKQFKYYMRQGKTAVADACQRLPDHLKVAILDESRKNGQISNRRSQLLYAALTDFVSQHLAASPQPDVIPRYVWSGLENCVFRVYCEDESSLEFLVQAVTSIPPPWDDARLTVVNSDHIPKFRTALVFVPYCNDKPEEVLLRFKRQNEGLNTDLWSVYHRTVYNGKGQRLLLVIDEESAQALKRTGCAAYNGLWKIVFKFREKRECPNLELLREAGREADERLKALFGDSPSPPASDIETEERFEDQEPEPGPSGFCGVPRANGAVPSILEHQNLQLFEYSDDSD